MEQEHFLKIKVDDLGYFLTACDDLNVKRTIIERAPAHHTFRVIADSLTILTIGKLMAYSKSLMHIQSQTKTP